MRQNQGVAGSFSSRRAIGLVQSSTTLSAMKSSGRSTPTFVVPLKEAPTTALQWRRSAEDCARSQPLSRQRARFETRHAEGDSCPKASIVRHH